ncbi:MAG: hypothetical protein EBS06_08835, partial [Proteobacteria bacterium]|nr:hypothetical protein [Pseudomonadota bacterium]
NTILQGTLNVSSISILQGNVSLLSNMNISGNMIINGSVNVFNNKFTIDNTGNTSLLGTFNINNILTADQIGNFNVNNNFVLDQYNNVNLGKYELNNYGSNWNINNHNYVNSNYFTSPIAMSNNSKYQYVKDKYRLSISSNYGNTWTDSGLLNNSGDINAFSNPITSYNGSIVYVSVNNILYVSTNYGITFTQMNNNSYNWLISGSFSLNGQYQYLYCGNASNYTAVIQYSSDYGNTWNYLSGLIFTGIINNWNTYKVFSSSIGNYVAIYTPNQYYYSNNYGNTFTVSNNSFVPINCANNTLFKIINFICYESLDFGLSWIQLGNLPNNYGPIIDLQISNNTKYLIAYCNSTIFLSYNYGNTWSIGLDITTSSIYNSFGSVNLFGDASKIRAYLIPNTNTLPNIPYYESINTFNSLYNLNIDISGNTNINQVLKVQGNKLVVDITGNTTIIGNNYIIGNNIVSGNTIISNTLNVLNISINSSLFVSNNTILQGNATMLNNLNILGDANIAGKASFNGLNISTLTTINGTITSNLNVSNLTTLNNVNLNNISINSSLNISGNSTFNKQVQINISNQTGIYDTLVLANLPNYLNNTAAKNAGIPLWGVYRTGGIIKIRLDDTPPLITLLGGTSVSLISGNNYIDSGIIVTDNTDSNLPGYITFFGLQSSTTNLINSPLLVSGTSTIVAGTSSLSNGNYIITYTATDSNSNIGNTNRLLTYYTPATFYLWTSSILNTSYRRLTTNTIPLNISNNPTILSWNWLSQNVGGAGISWGLSTSFLNTIGFKFNSSWCFVFKIKSNSGSSYQINFDCNIINNFGPNTNGGQNCGNYQYLLDGGSTTEFPTNIPIIQQSDYTNGIFISLSYNYSLNNITVEVVNSLGNIILTSTSINNVIYTNTDITNTSPFIIYNQGSLVQYYSGIYCNNSGYVPYSVYNSYFV